MEKVLKTWSHTPKISIPVFQKPSGAVRGVDTVGLQGAFPWVTGRTGPILKRDQSQVPTPLELEAGAGLRDSSEEKKLFPLPWLHGTLTRNCGTNTIYHARGFWGSGSRTGQISEASPLPQVGQAEPPRGRPTTVVSSQDRVFA